MFRRQFLSTLAAGSLRRKLVAAPSESVRPNILFVMADDLGYADLSCYGRRDYKTPNIDRLADQGTRFLQAYSNGAVCSPTRTALLTGRYPHRLPVGLEEPIPGRTPGRDPGLPPAHPTMASLFRAAGYRTSLVGKWHQGRLPNYSPLRSGYEYFFGFRAGGVDYFTHKWGPPQTDTSDLWENDNQVERPGYMTDLLTDKADELLRGYAKAKQPFFLSVHFSAPHWPWEGPADKAVAETVTDLAHFDGGSQATYAAMVKSLDNAVGKLLQRLEQSGLSRNTVVVFTSDNGGERFSDNFPFRGNKAELLEGGIRVPAIVRWPGLVAAGKVSEQVLITMDWLPTLLGCAGLGPDPKFPSDGIDLSGPLLGKTKQLLPRKLYWRHRLHSQRAVREGRFKWLQINGNSFLFDLENDPMERANLKRKMPELAEAMAASFKAWNQTMLAEDSDRYSHGFLPSELPERYRTEGEK